jgi:hypothetical protein
MSRVVIENVKMGCSWTSYVAAADGCLRAAGFWNDETWKLAGLTGMAFHFIVHKGLCPSSVTVYNWNDEHVDAMDRIGIHAEAFGTWMTPARVTAAEVRRAAESRIKGSIDRGIPVLVWAPTRILEFGIVTGYDDAEGAWLVEQCTGAPADPLPYRALGASEVPMLAYELFLGKVPVEEAMVVRSSLAFGLAEWNKEFHLEPDTYASGRKGYRAFVTALESGAINDFGLAYLIAVYGDAKAALARYLSWAADSAAGRAKEELAEAAKLFGGVAGRFAEMAKLAPFAGENGRGKAVDRARLPEIGAFVNASFELEEQAMGRIAAALDR